MCIRDNQECPPSQPPRLIAARIRLMTSRCRTPSRSLCSYISRKTAKTVPFKLSKYLYKNTFYNYAEQLVGFSLNCCTREWNSCNSPQPIVENIWYWTWGYFVPHAQTFKVFRMHIRTVNCSILHRLGSLYHYYDYSVIMVALRNRADHYIFALWFVSSFFFLLFFIA